MSVNFALQVRRRVRRPILLCPLPVVDRRTSVPWRLPRASGGIPAAQCLRAILGAYGIDRPQQPFILLPARVEQAQLTDGRSEVGDPDPQQPDLPPFPPVGLQQLLRSPIDLAIHIGWLRQLCLTRSI